MFYLNVPIIILRNYFSEIEAQDDVLKIDYKTSARLLLFCRASTAVAWRFVRLIQLKVCGGIANFMLLGVKLVGRFFPFEIHRQVFNFYNEPFMKPASRWREERRLSVSQTRRSRARQVCNINKFAAKTRPRRAIPKGLAGAMRKTENARRSLVKFSIRANRRAATFNAL